MLGLKLNHVSKRGPWRQYAYTQYIQRITRTVFVLLCFLVYWYRSPEGYRWWRALRWRHNGCDSVSNHQPYDCLLSRLFRPRWKKTSKLRVTGLCVGNSPGPVNSPHKGPVTRKMFPFDDVIMSASALCERTISWYKTTTWPNIQQPIYCKRHGPLTRYVKLQVAHAPGMPGTFSPAADFKGNRWLAIPACITARAWRTCRDACRDRLPAVTGKTFPAFPAHAHPQICVSGKRPMSPRLLQSRRQVTDQSSWQVTTFISEKYETRT